MISIPINTTRGADPDIVRSLMAIRRLGDALPAFKRGQMFFDFDLGKVCVPDTSVARFNGRVA